MPDAAPPNRHQAVQTIPAFSWVIDHWGAGEAGGHMKVTVHDHVIVGANGRTSLRAMGLI